MKILILGCTGMIGNSIFHECFFKKKYEVFGTYKNYEKLKFFKNKKNFIYFNVDKMKSLKQIIIKIKPDIIINCIGLTKHLKIKNEKKIFKINSIFPHYVKKISNSMNIKFVQISTDCVFSGKKGNYHENTKPDARDIYGRSKAAGEFNDNFNLTVRTSTIGHEIDTKYGLLEWFLSTEKNCEGFAKAYFNGFPTYYFSKILLKILDKYKATGLIHISGHRINKYKLLKIIKKTYSKKININRNDIFKIDRTLNNSKLKKFIPSIANWDQLITQMKKNYDQ